MHKTLLYITYLPGSDCSNYYNKANYTPGVKSIFINVRKVNVFCDEAGWTVFQSRGQFGNPKDYFFRDWDSYEKGFGIPGMLSES